MSDPLMSSAIRAASKIPMLEYWYRAPGAKSRRVRMACSANSVSGACCLRSSLLLAS